MRHVVKWVVVALVAALVLTALGYHYGEKAEAAQGCYRHPQDWGQFVYLNYPDSLMRAIRVAEGAPSYGVLYLARKHGGHQNVPWQEGRRAAAKIVHKTYRAWWKTGCPGSFLSYLGSRYAPVGAASDNGTNQHWTENVALNLATQLIQDGAR